MSASDPFRTVALGPSSEIVNRKFRNTLIVSLPAFLPVPALAEVSDKMPTITDHWIFAVPVAIVALLLGRYRWQLGVAFLLVPLWMFSGVVYLFFFDSVGSGLIAEQGIKYLVSEVGAASLVFAMCLVGIIVGRGRAPT